MTIAFINQKGGVGKTTCAINIGSALADMGHKVLLVDFDPQTNLSSGVGANTKVATIYDVLSQTVKVEESIQATYQKNLFVIPSSNDLSGAAVELVSVENREYYLAEAISPIVNDYKFVFIDCPPSLGLLTINAFCAAHSIIIPLQCEYYAMEGIAQLIQSVTHIQQGANTNLSVFGIVLTMYDTRTKLSQEVATEIVNAFGSNVFQTIIPRNVKIAEAPSYGQSVITYDKNCVGSKSYLKLSEEIFERWQSKNKK